MWRTEFLRLILSKFFEEGGLFILRGAEKFWWDEGSNKVD